MCFPAYERYRSALMTSHEQPESLTAEHNSPPTNMLTTTGDSTTFKSAQVMRLFVTPVSWAFLQYIAQVIKVVATYCFV